MILCALFANGCNLIPVRYADAPKAEDTPRKRFSYPITFSAEKAAFHAGFAKRRITPRTIQWLAGFLPSRLGTVVHDDLWCKCLIIEDESNTAVGIVSLDLIGLLPSDVKDIQKSISSFFHGKVLIHTTHTHSAPDIQGLWGFWIGKVPLFSGRDPRYLYFVKGRVPDCLREAETSKDPAVVAFAAGRLRGVAHGPSGIQADESLMLMHVLTRGNSVLLVNYAVHPDVMNSKYVTADLLHYTYEFLEQETGSDVMYINGAIGAVQPEKPRNEWSHARKLGFTIGREALDLLKSERVSQREAISWKTRTLRMTVENENFIKATEFHLMPDQRGADGKIPVEINYAVIGDAGIITFPGEAFPNVAMQVKSRVPDRYQFTFGLTNAGLGYILSSSDYASGRYGYHVSVSVSSTIGDEIVQAFPDLIQ